MMFLRMQFFLVRLTLAAIYTIFPSCNYFLSLTSEDVNQVLKTVRKQVSNAMEAQFNSRL